MTRFEDTLRERKAAGDPGRISSAERDAIVDALKALRDLLRDENAGSIDAAEAALARLDAGVSE